MTKQSNPAPQRSAHQRPAAQRAMPKTPITKEAVQRTKSRASVMAFAHELTRLTDKHARSIGAEELVVVQLGGSAAGIHHLYNDRESPIVWLSTIELLAGVDLGPSVACYVACKVSLDAQHRLVSMVARPRGNTKEAFIVDYAGNHWDSMLANKW